MALCPGLPGWASTRKVKPIWILLKQETVSGSGISWAICKSAPCSRQIATPAPHRSIFTGRMPFLPPNQQHQSTEGQIITLIINWNTSVAIMNNLHVLFNFAWHMHFYFCLSYTVSCRYRDFCSSWLGMSLCHNIVTCNTVLSMAQNMLVIIF